MIYVYILTHTVTNNTHICVYTHICTYIYVCVYVNINIPIPIYIYTLWNWWRRKTYLGSHHKASLHFVLEPACLQVSADAAQHERSVDLARWMKSDDPVWGYCFHTPKTRKTKTTQRQAKGENKNNQKHKRHTAHRLFTAAPIQSLYVLSKFDFSHIWLTFAGHRSAWKTLLGGKCGQLRCLQIQREIFESTFTRGTMFSNPFQIWLLIRHAGQFLVWGIQTCYSR